MHDSRQLRVLSWLAANGPASGGELRELLGVSQPTVSRIRVGETRGRRYAARREIAGLQGPVPVTRIGADGRLESLGDLHPIHSLGFWWSGEDSRFFDEVPWFLHDLRPGGFLGRLVPRQHPAEGYPADVRDWSSDTLLHYLAHHGLDLSGDLVVGRASAAAVLARAVPEVAREDYPDFAADVLSGSPPGSSAQGEQPKFLARVDGVDRLVKFSPTLDSAVGVRISDLLRAEATALSVLAEAGIPAAEAEVHRLGGRDFLEVVRFDRLAGGGRLGLVTLEAVDLEFGGGLPGWSAAAAGLLAAGLMTSEVRHRIEVVDLFGALIANTDRHGANLSLWRDGLAVGGLAPVYDMLPMHFAPRGHEVVDAPWAPPAPRLEHARAWRSAWPLALRYWEALSGADLSDDFRGVASSGLAAVQALEPVLARLPQA